MQVEIDCGFPGGNVIVDGISGDQISLRHDQRDSSGKWFWWYFRVRGAAGGTCTFSFTSGNIVGVRGPAVSTDAGVNWGWLADSYTSDSFTYAFPQNASETRFAFSLPYLQNDLERFTSKLKRGSHLKQTILCKSRKNRAVELLHFGNISGEAKHKVFLTARHHCCESIANYVFEGIMRHVLEDRGGEALRDNVEFLAVPFVDKDGVEDGDQGKNRIPHDHGRDYTGVSIYPEVAAIRKLLPEWSGAGLDVQIDLHCPHIRGKYNEFVYIVGAENQSVWKEQQRFGELLESVQSGVLKYRASDNLPYGQDWNNPKNYGDGKSCGRWVSELPGVKLACSIEIPYANANGAVVTAETARAFGEDLAATIERYL